MKKVFAAAVVTTVIWAVLDRVVGQPFGWPQTNLIETFFAALGGAGMMATSFHQSRK